MVDKPNVKLIAFVGLPGTGKSAATVYATERGLPKVSFGDVMRNELQKAGLEFTQENERGLREKLRLDPNGDLMLLEIIRQINDLIAAGQHKIIIDGLGAWASYKRLRQDYPGSLVVVSFAAQRHIRLRRLSTRSDFPLDENQVNTRDYDEIETLNKGGVLAMADYFVSDNNSLEQLHSQLDNLFRELEF
jgi:dephospho-CoA kinase